MSGHTKWSEIKRRAGMSGKWCAVAGDDQVRHYFTDTERPGWWQAEKCGKGQAVGDSPSDARLGFAPTVCPSSPRTSRTSRGSMADLRPDTENSREQLGSTEADIHVTDLSSCLFTTSGEADLTKRRIRRDLPG